MTAPTATRTGSEHCMVTFSVRMAVRDTINKGDNPSQALVNRRIAVLGALGNEVSGAVRHQLPNTLEGAISTLREWRDPLAEDVAAVYPNGRDEFSPGVILLDFYDAILRRLANGGRRPRD